MNLFGTSKELQLGPRNCGEPLASPVKKKKGNSFIEEEEKLGCAVKNKKSIGGNWLRCYQARRNFSSSQGSIIVSLPPRDAKEVSTCEDLYWCCVVHTWELPFWPPNSVLVRFLFVNIHKSFLSMWSSLNIHSHLQERDLKGDQKLWCAGRS